MVQCCTANPDGRKRALVVGGGIANFTDVAATFNGIIRAMREKVSVATLTPCLYQLVTKPPVTFLLYFPLQQSDLKAARVSIYVRRGGPNYLKGLANMRALSEETGVPIEVLLSANLPF